MIHVFEGDTADAVWQMAAQRFRASHGTCLQQGRGGLTQELLHVCFSITDPRQRWITSRIPAMNPAFAIAEIVWIMGGRNDSAFINHWNPLLPKFAGSGKTYHGAYGFRLKHHFALDQLERAYRALGSDPNTRQIVLQIWDPTIDLPDANGKPAADDIPCNICAMVKIRDRHLEWTQIMRSSDLVIGLPYDIVQFTSLQEILAGWLGVEPGTYHHFSDSLHVYERDFNRVHCWVPTNGPCSTDSLCLPKVESERVFAALERRMEMMASAKISRNDLGELTDLRDVPEGYRNLLRVVAADTSRRRGWIDASNRVMEDCTNPSLIQLWNRWAERLVSA